MVARRNRTEDRTLVETSPLAQPRLPKPRAKNARSAPQGRAADPAQEYEAIMVERYARAFSLATSLWPRREPDGRVVIDADQFALFLGIDEDEGRVLATLVSQRLIERNFGRQLLAEDAVAFLRNHGRRWFEARFDRLVADLEEEVREEASRCAAAPKPATLTSEAMSVTAAVGGIQ